MAKGYTKQEILDYSNKILEKRIQNQTNKYTQAGAARGLTGEQIAGWLDPGFGMVRDAYNSIASQLEDGRTYTEKETRAILGQMDAVVRDTASSYNKNTPKPAAAQAFYTPMDYDAAYAKYYEQMQAAYNAAYNAQVAQVQAKIPEVTAAYDQARSQAYTGARTSAIGNNEALAAKGLAGGLYGTARSGVSESSRIAQDNALGNALNTANLQEQAAKNALTQTLLQASYTRDLQLAQTMGQAELEKISMQTADNQFSATFAQNAALAAQEQYNYLMQQQLQKALAKAQLQQNNVQNALDIFNLIGYAPANIANVLSLPVGTKTLSGYKIL